MRTLRRLSASTSFRRPTSTPCSTARRRRRPTRTRCAGSACPSFVWDGTARARAHCTPPRPLGCRNVPTLTARPLQSQAQLEFYRNRLIDGIEEKQRKMAEQTGFRPRGKATDSKAPEKRRRIGLAGERPPHARAFREHASVRCPPSPPAVALTRLLLRDPDPRRPRRRHLRAPARSAEGRPRGDRERRIALQRAHSRDRERGSAQRWQRHLF